MDKRLETFIGRAKFAEYLYGLGLVEHLLSARILDSKIISKSVTFGELRRQFDQTEVRQQFQVAQEFGFSNQKEFSSFLRHLNAIRNRAAHHARIWNYREKVAAPRIVFRGWLRGIGSPESAHSVAATLCGIQIILQETLDILPIGKSLEAAIFRSGLERTVLLKAMGFHAS